MGVVSVHQNILQVLAGSPAEAGGLKVGDKISSLGGISVSDAKAQTERGRPEVGETWEFIVERDGETVSLDVTFGEPVTERKILAHAGFLVGFCFIIFTMRAYMSKQTSSSHTLAIAGVLFSLVFLAGPYFGSHLLRQIDGALTTLLVFLGVASILNFLMVHLRDGGNRMLYLPAIAAGLFIAWRILATPEATPALNNFGNVFVGVIVGFYLLASLVTVFRSYSGSTAEEKDAKGLQLMLIGALIGLVPPVIAIPLTWSMAVSKGAAN